MHWRGLLRKARSDFASRSVVKGRYENERTRSSPLHSPSSLASQRLQYRGCTTEDVAALCSRIVDRSPTLRDPRLTDLLIRISLNVVGNEVNHLRSAQLAQDSGHPLHPLYSFDRIVEAPKPDDNLVGGTEADPSPKPSKRIRKTHIAGPHFQNTLWNLPHGFSRSHPGKLPLCIGCRKTMWPQSIASQTPKRSSLVGKISR